jgi:hypothetical protein
VHLTRLEKVHLIVRIGCAWRHEAQRAAALGAQPELVGGGIERRERGRGPEPREPRAQRLVDRMGQAIGPLG